MGHRRYLPENHVWRRSRLHDGNVEHMAPPVVMNGTIKVSDLDRLQADIIIILYKLERIFPSAFFNVMYVQTKARPKGSIAEAYVMNESSTFCSRYLSGIKTRFTRDERNDDTIPEDEVIGEFEIFKQKVIELRESRNLSHDFFSLTMGPSFDVRCYNGCIVGGLRFHTLEHDYQHTTQNSRVMVTGESDASGSGDNNFYSVLDEVLHVQYPIGRNVWLFKCRWYDMDVNKNQRTHVELGYKSHNTSHFLFAEEPNKRIPDVPKVDNVENEHLNALEIIISHRVDEHIEDDTLCRTNVDPTIIERPVVRHVIDDFIDDVDEHLSHKSTISSFSSGFDKIDAMFLEFVEELDNPTEGSLSVGDNSSTSQPSTTPTLRRRAQSQLLELDHYVAAN
ncbi:hypothetical protein E6C27_scaffold404G00510 [Cucumis melo var. makuwa]|uniref:DUF4218 domain-containing protein n=1 Tax=Cucumis melo var. makuwa TaxID=1194695 RepID=A0A5A7U6C2_CUCMM|nr:hypothetical protein E6C27_scaffold404G00510 [Cucumis melo var. makuwa]